MANKLNRISEREWKSWKDKKRLLVEFNQDTHRHDVKLYHKGIIKYISNYQDKEDAIKTAEEYVDALVSGGDE